MWIFKNIYKVLLCAAFSILMVAVLPGRAEAQKGLLLGVEAGPNFTTRSWSYDEFGYTGWGSRWTEYESFRTRTVVRLFGRYNFLKFMGVQSGLTYAPMGFRQIYYNDSPYEEVVLKSSFNYLQIPLQLSFTYPSGMVRPRLDIGPYFGFLLKANEVLAEYDLDDDVVGNEVDVQDRYRNMDLGIIVDIGIDVEVNRMCFSAEINYGQSLRNIMTDEAVSRYHGDNYLDYRENNVFFGFSLGAAYFLFRDQEGK